MSIVGPLLRLRQPPAQVLPERPDPSPTMPPQELLNESKVRDPFPIKHSAPTIAPCQENPCAGPTPGRLSYKSDLRLAHGGRVPRLVLMWAIRVSAPERTTGPELRKHYPLLSLSTLSSLLKEVP